MAHSIPVALAVLLCAVLAVSTGCQKSDAQLPQAQGEETGKPLVPFMLQMGTVEDGKRALANANVGNAKVSVQVIKFSGGLPEGWYVREEPTGRARREIQPKDLLTAFAKREAELKPKADVDKPRAMAMAGVLTLVSRGRSKPTDPDRHYLEIWLNRIEDADHSVPAYQDSWEEAKPDHAIVRVQLGASDQADWRIRGESRGPGPGRTAEIEMDLHLTR